MPTKRRSLNTHRTMSESSSMPRSRRESSSTQRTMLESLGESSRWPMRESSNMPQFMHESSSTQRTMSEFSAESSPRSNEEQSTRSVVPGNPYLKRRRACLDDDTDSEDGLSLLSLGATAVTENDASIFKTRIAKTGNTQLFRYLLVMEATIESKMQGTRDDVEYNVREEERKNRRELEAEYRSKSVRLRRERNNHEDQNRHLRQERDGLEDQARRLRQEKSEIQDSLQDILRHTKEMSVHLKTLTISIGDGNKVLKTVLLSMKNIMGKKWMSIGRTSWPSLNRREREDRRSREERSRSER